MKKIILLGPKHCGKTSVGKALCEYIEPEVPKENSSLGNRGCQEAPICIDLDKEITKTTGKTPRELYKEGVEVFQKAEADIIRNIAQRHKGTKLAIAVGGGIIDNHEAVSILKSLDAVKVYLNISPETAWQRISAAGELPPFLQTDNPQETHRALHERRAEAYRQLADITINVEEKTPQEIAQEILAKLYKLQ